MRPGRAPVLRAREIEAAHVDRLPLELAYHHLAEVPERAGDEDLHAAG
jgi:hypothetical protein